MDTPSSPTESWQPAEEYRLPALRISRRQQLDRQRRIGDQLGRGRPDTSWPRCGMGSCVEPRCTYRDGRLTLLNTQLLGSKSLSVKVIMAEFGRVAASHLWATKKRPDNVKSEDVDNDEDDDIYNSSKLHTRARSIEAFAQSPPIRSAFAAFVAASDQKPLHLTEPLLLRQLPLAHLFILELIAHPHDVMTAASIHSSLGPITARHMTRYDALVALVRTFLVEAETWRRHALTAGHPWALPLRSLHPIAAAELLVSLLLHLWLVHREGRLRVDEDQVGEEAVDDAWEEWLREYADPARALAGEVVQDGPSGRAVGRAVELAEVLQDVKWKREEEECFEGIGRGHTIR